jgi:transcriptional regulator with XRE-family HTH domain
MTEEPSRKEPSVRTLRLTSAQRDLLCVLLEQPDIRYRELLERMGLAAPRLWDLLTGLVRRRYLERLEDRETTGRRGRNPYRYTVTGLGRAAVESSLPADLRAVARAREPFATLRLALLRRRWDLKRSDLAERMAVSADTVAHIERHAPRLPRLAGYLAALGARLVLRAEFGTQHFELHIPPWATATGIESVTLKSLRRARGLTQEELAARAGISYRTVQAMESGRRVPRVSTLADLVQAFGGRLTVVATFEFGSYKLCWPSARSRPRPDRDDAALGDVERHLVSVPAGSRR